MGVDLVIDGCFAFFQILFSSVLLALSDEINIHLIMNVEVNSLRRKTNFLLPISVNGYDILMLAV